MIPAERDIPRARPESRLQPGRLSSASSLANAPRPTKLWQGRTAASHDDPQTGTANPPLDAFTWKLFSGIAPASGRPEQVSVLAPTRKIYT